MTDHELLELAAKAAGISITWSKDCFGNETGPWVQNSGWRPLDNDGDALRLAMKLGMCINVQLQDKDGYQSVSVWSKTKQFRLNKKTTIEEATRRAIVRAAAEIGKGLAPFPTADEIRENWL